MGVIRKSAAGAVIVLLMSSALPTASAAPLPACSKGKAVKVVKGKATMLYKGKRVACTKAVATPKPTGPVVSAKPEVRFTSNTMNDLVYYKDQTITIRNTDSVPHTLVVVGTDISVLTPANDISAFRTPSKSGTYQMTTLENPNIKATLIVP